MKKALAFLLTILLLTVSLPGVAEEWEDAFSPTLEDQIIEMSACLRDAIVAKDAEDYKQEAIILQRITDHSTEVFPDEVTWAWSVLGDLYAEGLYHCQDEEDWRFEKTSLEMAVYCYEQARAIYWNRKDLENRKDKEYMYFQADIAFKLGKIYVSSAWKQKDYPKALSCFLFASLLSKMEEQRIEAHYQLGLIYADEASDLYDLNKARNELYGASHAGHEAACQKVKELNGNDAYEWALYYLWDNDYIAAAQILIPAAEQGDVRCMKQLGLLYQSGQMGERGALYGDSDFDQRKNLEQARYWFEKAAEAGDEEAAEWLERIGSEGKTE